MSSLEDIFCLLLIFFFDKILFPQFEKKGNPLTPLKRIGLGFFFVTLSFGVSGILQLWIQSSPDAKIHIAWQIPQIFFMAIAEIMVTRNG